MRACRKTSSRWANISGSSATRLRQACTSSKEAFRSGFASRRVPVEGGVEVRPRASEKRNSRHHSPRLLCGALQSLIKATPRTTSQGMVVAVPAESSADRRRISAIHSSESGGSASSGNVSQRASINSSRSATGSCAASASSASMVLIVPTFIVFGEYANVHFSRQRVTFGRLTYSTREQGKSREPILHHHLRQGQLATLLHGGFHCLADRDHEADHVVAWQVDDLGYLHRVEADAVVRIFL